MARWQSIIEIFVVCCLGQGPGEVFSGVRPNHPGLVLVVRVLDVLRQPVLGPVDLLAVDRGGEAVQDNSEPVVLHLVVDTVKVGDGAEPLLLVCEVRLHGLDEGV